MLKVFMTIFKAPKAARVHAGKSSRSPGNAPQQLPGSQWDNIIKFLDTLMSRLRGNHVSGTFFGFVTSYCKCFGLGLPKHQFPFIDFKASYLRSCDCLIY